jgi:hypothetical protein
MIIIKNKKIRLLEGSFARNIYLISSPLTSESGQCDYYIFLIRGDDYYQHGNCKSFYSYKENTLKFYLATLKEARKSLKSNWKGIVITVLLLILPFFIYFYPMFFAGLMFVLSLCILPVLIYKNSIVFYDSWKMAKNRMRKFRRFSENPFP